MMNKIVINNIVLHRILTIKGITSNLIKSNLDPHKVYQIFQKLNNGPLYKDKEYRRKKL